MYEIAGDDLSRWSALSEPGDKLAGAIYRLRPDLISGDLDRLTDAKTLTRELSDEGFSDYLHVAPAFAERLALRVAAVNAAKLRSIGQHFGATPLAVSGLPWSLRKNFSRLGDSGPLVLWVLGNTSALAVSPRIAFVGTRIPSGYSERIVRRAVGSFSQQFCLISGGALGVDALSHRAALESDICTIAFLAGGIDRIYPDSHATLFKEIAQAGGAIVSEAPPGTAPTRWRFLQRNRIIAAASDLLVVTEAGARSGARNTVSHANECGVRVLIAPGPIDSETSKGTNLMIAEQLGEPLLEPSSLEADFVSGNRLTELTSEGESQADAANLSQISCRVLDAMATRSTVLDIARECGLESRVVSNQLAFLASTGLAVRDGIYWVRHAPKRQRSP